MLERQDALLGKISEKDHDIVLGRFPVHLVLGAQRIEDAGKGLAGLNQGPNRAPRAVKADVLHVWGKDDRRAVHLGAEGLR